MIPLKKLDTTYFTFSILSGFNNINQLVSSRYREEGKNFNLSYAVGDDAKNVNQNRKKICETFGIDESNLFLPVQCHTNNVVILGEENASLENTDALITSIPGKCIGVLAADCVPVLLYDAKKQVIAAIHAGWKGTFQQIVSKTVKKMSAQFTCNPKDIYAGIGPSISQKNYEVGIEVFSKFKTRFPNEYEKFIDKKSNEKAGLNLWEANKLQLLKAGMPEKNIEISGICTFDNIDTFFSARKDGFNTGRFGAFIMIKK